MNSQWTLHFHHTFQGKTKRNDLYSLRADKNMIMFIVEEGASDLVKLVERAMNTVEEKEYTDFPKELRDIMFGPWIVEQGVRYIKLAEKSMRKISHMLFHESAERHMAEHNYATLKREFDALQKAYSLQGNALLRSQANARVYRDTYIGDNGVTYTDLLDQPNDDQNELPLDFKV